VIIDDHRVFVEALALLLEGEADIDLVGTATEGIEGYELCERLRPDVALVDVGLPDVDGVSVTMEIARRSPRTSVVVISALADDDLVIRAIDAGAVGFVHKVSAVDQLLAVVRGAASGNIVLPEDRHDEILRRLAERPSADTADFELTPEEREVLVALTKGMTPSDAAGNLGKSEPEVRSDINAIVSKLGARSLLEAVLVGLRHGIVTLDGPA
jgi:DNA-binding NarL/FixJ family response regulator